MINMPLRISLQNRRRIVRLYLEGYPQVKITDSIGVAQSTVSNEIRRFINIAESSSLGEATKMYDVDELVEELRALSVDLRKLRKSPKECLEAAKDMRSILEAGLEPSNVKDFLRLCKKLQAESSLPREYLQYAVRLSKLEDETARGYVQILKDFEETAKGLKEVEAQMITLRSDIKVLKESRSSLQKELAVLEEGVKKKMEETALTNEKIETALRIEALKKSTGVSAEGLEEFLGKMKTLNWDLETINKMMKELRGTG